MCGIAGIYNTGGQPTDLSILQRMAAQIAHRGPDGERFYQEGGIGLAHRHLRIIDLSDAAMQPMSNEDSTLQVILNGEIYNYIELRAELRALGHHFRTQSDTEVLLRAYERWGLDCLQHFNGMFAFALWDSPRRRLFLARDRMGVKPLYYRWDGHTLIFASEIKALLSCPGVPRRPYMSAIAEYMSAMYTTGEETWFEGIKRLLPGQFITATPEGLGIKKWWSLPEHEDQPGEHTEQSYIERTRELLEDSIRLRLRSDVPLGAHLSGGIDSSLIVGLLSKAGNERIRTFSGAFEMGNSFDERRYARLAARRFHTEHHETLPTSSDLKAWFSQMLWHMDEPAGGPGIALQWAVCRLTASSGVRVINGGQGGDEIWGGYYGYIPPYLRTLIAQVRRFPRLTIPLARALLGTAPQPALRQGLMRALRQGRSGRLRPTSGSGEWAGAALRAAPGDLGRSHTDEQFVQITRGTPLASAMRWDQQWYLPALLQVEDRTSMAFSLESRAPLLDYRLVELAATVPSELRLKNLTLKYMLRKAGRDLLPTEIYRRTDKMGMPTPIAAWFCGSLQQWAREELLLPNAHANEIISQSYARRCLDEHATGRHDHSIQIWKMLCLSGWWRMFIEADLPTSSLLRTDTPIRASVST